MNVRESCISNEPSCYRALLNAFHEAVFILEPKTGNIVDANEHAGKMYDYSPEVILGLSLDRLSVGLAPCSPQEAKQWMQKTLKEGPQHFEWLCKANRGRLFWVEIHLSPIALRGQDYLFASLRDISDAKKAASEHAIRMKRLEAQSLVFLSVAEAGTDYRKGLSTLAHFLSTELGDLCVLELANESGSLLPMAHDQPYLDGKSLLPSLSEITSQKNDRLLACQALAKAEAIHMEDATGSAPLASLREEYHPFLRRYHVHSLLVVPIRARHGILGTITLAKGGGSHAYTLEEQSMVQNLADRTALVLSNAKLFADNLNQADALRTANQMLEIRVQERTQELEEANVKLQRLAVEDALTGLANRRRFNEILEEETRRMRRIGSLLSLLICDVDFFKRYNDAYGHGGGDECLRCVGKVMRDVFRRAGETPARYGGEEFAVVLPGVDHECAYRVAEKLRAAMEARAILHAHSEASEVVTLSIGVATAMVQGHMNPEWFIEKADAALYQAKHAGRNRVVAVQCA